MWQTCAWRNAYQLSTYYLYYTREFEKALKRLAKVEELNIQKEIFNAEEMADLY